MGSKLVVALFVVVFGAGVAGFFARCPLESSGGWEDETRCGVEVEWGSQVDRDICPVVAACPEGARGARVAFVDDPATACYRPGKSWAGCYDPNFDFIYVKPAATLAQTALLHEFKHRYLLLKHLPDSNMHTEEIWQRDTCDGEDAAQGGSGAGGMPDGD